jgi:hypothetical protein
LLIQLKLSPRVRNVFEYCDVELTLQNQVSIENMDGSPTSGSVTVSSDRKTMKWTIGQKFNGRNLELALPAILYVEGKSKLSQDPFFVNQNSFIKVSSKESIQLQILTMFSDCGWAIVVSDNVFGLWDCFLIDPIQDCR